MARGLSGLPVQKQVAKVLQIFSVILGNIEKRCSSTALESRVCNKRPCPGVLREKDGHKFVMQSLFKTKKTLF